MRYIGSKQSSAELIVDLVQEQVEGGSLCDPFGGTGTIGAAFKRRGYRLWSGDQLYFAYSYQVSRLGPSPRGRFLNLKRELSASSLSAVEDAMNRLRPQRGWITRHYAEPRRFFTPENAQLIDACRLQIGRWRREKVIDQYEALVLTASLIDSADRVANTAGTYYAYLKSTHRKAKVRFAFRFIGHVPGPRARVHWGDALDVLSQRHYDIIYLDPPHSARNYASYYHLPETLARGRTPHIHGMSGVPLQPWARSAFCSPGTAQNALDRLLKNLSCRLLLLHYSERGLVPMEWIRTRLTAFGRVAEHQLEAPGYTTRCKDRVRTSTLFMAERD